MPWLRFDDQFTDHPKVVQVGPLAGWLHVCGIIYCGRYLTDGFIKRQMIPRLADWTGVCTVDGMQGHDIEAEELVVKLIEAGLWEECNGGYFIHDYLDYNPSREEVLAQRDAKAEAGRRGGLASVRSRKAKAVARAKADAKARATAKAKAPPQAESKQSIKQNSTPYPYPYPEEQTTLPPTSGGSDNGTGGGEDTMNKNQLKTVLAEYFAELTKLRLPDCSNQKKAKEANVLWFTPLLDVAGEVDNDVERSKALIRRGVNYNIKKNLPLASPKSIRNVAVNIAAANRRSGGPDGVIIDDGPMEVIID